VILLRCERTSVDPTPTRIQADARAHREACAETWYPPSCLALAAVCKGLRISDLPRELSFSNNRVEMVAVGSNRDRASLVYDAGSWLQGQGGLRRGDADDLRVLD
jgi:hypothetical protein